jgi:hypothetical protein
MGKYPYFPKIKSTWNKAQEYEQVSTPSNPTTNNNKLYFKNDGSLYKLDSLGVESEVGGGGGLDPDTEMEINGITLKLKEWILF